MAVFEISSEVDICNLALSHLKDGRRIQSIDQKQSLAAAECRLHYDHLRKSLLRNYQFNFSSKIITLNLIPGVPDSHYVSAYAVPANILRVVDVHGLSKDEWEIFSGAELHCDLGAGSLDVRVVLNETNVESFDDLFIDAFALLLAKRLGSALGVSKSRLSEIGSDFDLAIAKARTIDAFERRAPESDYECRFITARY